MRTLFFSLVMLVVTTISIASIRYWYTLDIWGASDHIGKFGWAIVIAIILALNLFGWTRAIRDQGEVHPRKRIH